MLYLIETEARASSQNVFEQVENGRVLFWTLLAFRASGCLEKSIFYREELLWGDFLIFFLKSEFPT